MSTNAERELPKNLKCPPPAKESQWCRDLEKAHDGIKKKGISIGGFTIQDSPFKSGNYWMQCNDGEGMEISEKELNEKLNSLFWGLF